jgi:hypothetical protein
MRSVTPFAAMLLIAFSAAQSRDIRMGAVELSGQGSYMMNGGDAISQSVLMVSPSAAIYLSQYLNFGPVFSWQRFHTDETAGIDSYESTSSLLSIGAKFGVLANYTDMIFRPLPFFDVSAGPEIVSSSFTGGSDHSKMGALITGTLGAKFRLSESFLFAAFFSIADHSLQHFEIVDTFGFGFSGLI